MSGNVFLQSPTAQMLREFDRANAAGLPDYASIMQGDVPVAPRAPGASSIAPAGDTSLPRGLRNNNPLNIEAGSFTQRMPGFQGSDGRFARFETQDQGIAAADALLQSYAARGLNTPAGIIGRWAPAAEAGNNVSAYAGSVARALGIGPNDRIDMQDPAQRRRLIEAMAQVENGRPLLSAPQAAPAPPAAPIDPSQLFARQPASPDAATPAIPEPLLPAFEAAAQQHNVPIDVLLGLAEQESGYDPRYIGPRTQFGRASGVMGLHDSTASRLGVNPFVPGQAIEGVARRIRQSLDAGATMEEAIREHHGGPDRSRWGADTQRYGEGVLSRADRIANAVRSRYAAQPEAVAPQDAGAMGPQPNAGSTGLGDAGRSLKIGANEAALNFRELASRVLPAAAIEVIDGIDRWWSGQSSGELLRTDSAAMRAQMTPAMREAMDKNWWNEEQGTFGLAWRDPRAYLSGVLTSAPEMAVTMVPAMRIARLAYAGRIAAGATPEAAATAAARAATLTGSLMEGALGGASTARAVRERVLELPQETLDKSEAYRSLVASGLSPADARRAMAERASTTGFVAAGVATGIFGGMGDRAIAGIVAEGVGGGLARRITGGAARGAVGEGLFEELPQSALQQVAENFAVRQANPGQSLGEGVAEQAAGGLAIGMAQGGGMGAAGGAMSRREPPATPAPSPLPAANAAPSTLPSPPSDAAPPPVASAPDASPPAGAAPVAEPPPAGPLTRALGQQAAASMNAGAEVMIEVEGLDPIPGTVEYETPQGVMVRTEEGALLVEAEDIRTGAARVVPVRGASPPAPSVAPGAPAAEGSEPAAGPVAGAAAPQSAPQMATSPLPSAPPASDASAETGQAPAPEQTPGPAAPAPASRAITPAEAWPLVRAGTTERDGAPVDALIGAKAARDAGGINDRKQLAAFLTDWNRAVEAAGLDPRTEAGNAAAMAVVRRHAISLPEFAARSRAQEAKQADAAEIDIDTASEAELRGRLRHLARQANAAGGKPTPALVAERKRVEAAINRLASAAKQAVTASEAPQPPAAVAAPVPPKPKPARPPKAVALAAAAMPEPTTLAPPAPARPASEAAAFSHAYPSGYPSGGYHAIDTNGAAMRGKAEEGEMPPRFKTPEAAAAAFAPKQKVGKPRSKPAATEETGHAKRARKTLDDAADGEVIQASAPVGYMAAGTPMRITRIEKNGTVFVENVATGAGTSLSRGELEGARQRGVIFSRVAATEAAAPAPAEPPALVIKNLRDGKETRLTVPELTPAAQKFRDETAEGRAKEIARLKALAAEQRKQGGPNAALDTEEAIARIEAAQAADERDTAKLAAEPTPAPAPPASKPADTNTVFTADAAEKARAILRAKLGTNAGAPSPAPEADIGNVSLAAGEPGRTPIRIGSAIIGHDLGVGRSHPDYEAAKAGDREAALRLARDLVDSQLVERVRQAIGRSRPVVVPVASIEAAGRNKIPLMVAAVLAEKLGLQSAADITQANAPKRTSLGGLDRLFSPPMFDGPVEPGREHLLVDDTITQGATFAAMASHIEAGGGRVVGAVALTGKAYSATLALSPATLQELRGKYGDVESDFREATGYGFDALTESEARYLARFRQAAAVRDRITSEGSAGRSRLGEREAGPGGVATSTPEGWGQAETQNDEAPLTPEALAALGDILRVIAGPEAVLEAGRTGGADGIAAGPLVRLAMSLGEDRANWVTGHEAIHTLRNLGRITDSEWTILTDAAAREGWGERFGTDRRYRNRSAEVRAEEAVAEAFAAWATGNLDGRGPVARIFQKVRSFLSRLRNALAGRGFKDRQSVFQAIRRGEMGRRAPGSAAPTRTGTATTAEISTALDRRVDAGVFTQDKDGLIHLSLPPEKRAEQDGKLRAFLRDVVERAQPAVLATVPLRPLLEEVAGYLPSAARFLRTKQAMDAMRAQWFSTSAELSNRWLKYRSSNKAENAALMDLMHETTLVGIDPSNPPADDGDADARAQYDALRARYDAMPAAGKALYAEVRNTYSKLADAFDAALMDNVSAAVMVAAEDAERAHRKETARIKASEAMSPEEKQEAQAKADKTLKRVQTVTKMNRGARMQKLRQQFESNRVAGPYFPLARFGEFFVTARDKAGKVVSYSLFEWPTEQRAFARQMEAEGYTVTMDRVSNEKGSMRSQVDPRFVAEVEGLLAGAKVPDDLQDAIWQRFLQRMPDMSIRTSRIHRKGTAGFTKDAIRAFGHHMFHGSHQLARLTYAMQLQDDLANAREEAESSGKPNTAVAVVNEMAERLDFIMNPTGAAWSHALTSAGFVYYLSASPAAALLNLTQTAMVGVPVLAASRGGSVGRASLELSRALKDVGSGFKAGEWRSGFVTAARSKNLTADEQALIREIYEIGLADQTQAHDLAGVAESGMAYSNTTHKVMSVISYGFHHAERVNREATALAAYRMQRKAGLDHAAAVEEANRLTWKIHYDYQATSRPRVMQGNTAKVVLLFRNFTVNMLFRLFRDTHQMVRGETVEVRREARTQLVGMTMMMMTLGGISGVWGYGLAMGLASLFFGPGEDEEDELRKWMQRNLGVTATGILMDGIPGWGLGVSVSERVGMPDLWLRSSDRMLESKAAFHELWGQFLGPVFYGIPANVWRGADMVVKGLQETGEWREVFRGIETAMPKSVRDLMRAGRFATEGALTQRGEPLMASVPATDVLKQALGFTPARLAEMYGQNTSLQNARKEVGDEREKLMNRYYRAMRADDQDEMRQAQGSILRFNDQHPEAAITPRSLMQSMRTRARNSAQTVEGVRLPPRMDGPLRERLPARTYN